MRPTPRCRRQYGIGAYSLRSRLRKRERQRWTGDVTAGKLYGLPGIVASSNNAGNISITTSTGDVINSGGTGISAGIRQPAPRPRARYPLPTFGIIKLGFDMSTGADRPGGIWAGYTPGGVNTVIATYMATSFVDNSAVINAASGWESDSTTGAPGI